MSEVKLNLIDSQQVFHGTIHGSVVDACVAALSAEPETIAELTSALTRYIRRLDDRSPFATFNTVTHHSSLFGWCSSLITLYCGWHFASCCPKLLCARYDDSGSARARNSHVLAR